jgi:hypothetical protein
MRHALRCFVGYGWALAALVACSSGTQPVSVEGTFALQTLNEAARPYDHEGLGCCTYLSGELRLGPGRYAVSLTARNRNTQVVFTSREWGRYTGPASALTFARDSFAVFPLGLDVGTLAGSDVRVAFGGEAGSSDQARAVFARLP